MIYTDKENGRWDRAYDRKGYSEEPENALMYSSIFQSNGCSRKHYYWKFVHHEIMKTKAYREGKLSAWWCSASGYENSFVWLIAFWFYQHQRCEGGKNRYCHSREWHFIVFIDQFIPWWLIFLQVYLHVNLYSVYILYMPPSSNLNLIESRLISKSLSHHLIIFNA